MSRSTVRQAPSIGGDFTLVDHDDQVVNRATFRGQYLLIFFGFTRCKVVCPRALDRLSRVLERLGPSVEQVQALYVSVDPLRDSPAVMRSFLRPRFPRFRGLTGTPQQVDAARAAFRVFAQRRATESGDYDVPHSAFTYLLDPTGRFIDHWPVSLDEDAMLHRLCAALAAPR